MKQPYKTDVIFRKDTTKEFKNTIFALFPHCVNDTTGNVLSYQHVGQHSSADYQHCISKSKLATETEYTDLKKELETIGYDLNIIKKQNHKKYLKNYYETRK
jgi:hypothetical protein